MSSSTMACVSAFHTCHHCTLFILVCMSLWPSAQSISNYRFTKQLVAAMSSQPDGHDQKVFELDTLLPLPLPDLDLPIWRSPSPAPTLIDPASPSQDCPITLIDEVSSQGSGSPDQNGGSSSGTDQTESQLGEPLRFQESPKRQSEADASSSHTSKRIRLVEVCCCLS